MQAGLQDVSGVANHRHRGMLVAGVFVSYSRESESAVRSLAADVEALEHTVWYDHDLSGGKVWWEQILAEIRNCNVFMIAISPDSLRSVACTSECGYAAALGKPILPILIADGVSPNLLPPRLSQIQFVDYRKQDKACAINLARALKALPPAGKLPEPLPAPPAAPLSYLGRITEQIDSGTPLDNKEQAALVSQLRQGVRDPETASDARSLLTRLRKRDDLFARIGDEIDELLDTPAHAAEPRHESPEPQIPVEPAPPPPPKLETTVRAAFANSGLVSAAAQPTVLGSTAKEASRLKCATWGAGLGGVFGALIAAANDSDAAIAIAPAIGGAIAGAIGRKSALVYSLSAAGAILGFVVGAVLFVAMDPYGEPAIDATVAVVPLGTVAGALIGAAIRKLRG